MADHGGERRGAALIGKLTAEAAALKFRHDVLPRLFPVSLAQVHNGRSARVQKKEAPLSTGRVKSGA
jgi:hypothetical protein